MGMRANLANFGAVRFASDDSLALRSESGGLIVGDVDFGVRVMFDLYCDQWE